MSKKDFLTTSEAVGWLEEIIECLQSGDSDVEYLGVTVTYSHRRARGGLETHVHSARTEYQAVNGDCRAGTPNQQSRVKRSRDPR